MARKKKTNLDIMVTVNKSGQSFLFDGRYKGGEFTNDGKKSKVARQHRREKQNKYRDLY